MALIDVAGIHVRFGDRVVLESIDLAVPKGEFHGLMGPNGAGKTTFFNVLTGRVKPSRGVIRLARAQVGQHERSDAHAGGQREQDAASAARLSAQSARIALVPRQLLAAVGEHRTAIGRQILTARHAQRVLLKFVGQR